MNDVSELKLYLDKLDASPRFLTRRKREVLKKFTWNRASQVSNLLRLGIWLDLIGEDAAGDRIFAFLSTPAFKGDWDVWACVQGSLLFLAFSARRRGADTSELVKRALAPGFLKERVNGIGLERLLKHLRSSTFERPFLEPICYLLEDIIMELRIMSILGGSEKYKLEELASLEQHFKMELKKIAEQI